MKLNLVVVFLAVSVMAFAQGVNALSVNQAPVSLPITLVFQGLEINSPDAAQINQVAKDLRKTSVKTALLGPIAHEKRKAFVAPVAVGNDVSFIQGTTTATTIPADSKFEVIGAIGSTPVLVKLAESNGRLMIRSIHTEGTTEKGRDFQKVPSMVEGSGIKVTLSPTSPLAPGQYAVVFMTGDDVFQAAAWDFQVK